MIIKLNAKDLERIMKVERGAFIPSIQTTEEIIKRRLEKKHIYLGIDIRGKLAGTLAFRFSHFIPNFADFCKRNPTFEDYAEKDNELDASAVFIYSIGIIPEHRNSLNAIRLLRGAFEIAKQKNMDFLVGDARIPSYNGSHNNLRYEKFDRNETIHRALDDYFRTGILPSRSLIERDHVAGFYLKIFPQSKILGITNNKFWEGDEPCNGHMVIEYLKLK